MKHTLVAFGATCRANAVAREDAGLCALIQSGARVVSVFGKASLLHVRNVLQVSPQENLRMIRESISFLHEAGREVFFDAEHFFDAYSDDPDYALDTLRAARAAGASRLVLCDTNGGTLPDQIEFVVRQAVKEMGAMVAVHCHNDAGLATACTMYGVKGGAVQVQGTINGLGERCGNANLSEVIPNLVLKMDRQCLWDEGLMRLTEVARTVNEVANMHMDEKSPYVGRSAFAHKGGHAHRRHAEGSPHV